MNEIKENITGWEASWEVRLDSSRWERLRIETRLDNWRFLCMNLYIVVRCWLKSWFSLADKEKGWWPLRTPRLIWWRTAESIKGDTIKWGLQWVSEDAREGDPWNAWVWECFLGTICFCYVLTGAGEDVAIIVFILPDGVEDVQDA
jgi:hypothetical protein